METASTLERHEEHYDFTGMSREELVTKLDEFLHGREIGEIISIVDDIESAYKSRNDERKEEELQNYLDEGGYTSDFVLEKDKTDSRFTELYNIYLDRKEKYFQQKKSEERENLNAKRQIIDNLKKLIESGESIGKAFQKFRELRDRWKQVGNVSSRQEEQLDSDYRFQRERFYHLMRITQGLKELDLEKHLEEKNALLKRMEELLEEKTIRKVEALIRKYHDDWYDIGPVPESQKDAVIGRFNEVTKQVYKRIRDHYEGLKQKYQQHLEQKQALCEKIENINIDELTTHRAWEKTTADVLQIQNDWKKIGRVPKEESEQVWDRFRKASNLFFEKKRAFYETLKKDYQENKQAKEKIISQAETLQTSTDWENTSKQLIRLQKQWQKIGPAGVTRLEQQLWKRFRAACDVFFNAKKDSFAALEQEKKNNLEKRKTIIARLEELSKNVSSKEDLTAIRDIGEEWKNAGEVSPADRESLSRQYSTLLDAAYEKMGMDSGDVEMLKYKNKIERLKNAENAFQQLDNERKFLRGKIRNVEDEVAKIENNMGFFAKSKTADALLKDFQANVEKSKKDLNSLKKKLEIVENNMPAKAPAR